MIIEHEHDRSGRWVLLAALCIHALWLGAFFMAEMGSFKIIPSAKTFDETPIIFQNQVAAPADAQQLPEEQLTQQKPPQQPDTSEWAAMTAGPSTLGMPQDGPEEAGILSDTTTDTAQSEMAEIPEIKNNAQDVKNIESQAQPIATPISENQIPQGTYLAYDQTACISDTFEIKPDEKIAAKNQFTTSLSASQKQAAQQLAAFTRGYLDQAAVTGKNLITLIGGDPNKRPGIEQLKYERYWAKVQWSLQNSFAINKDLYTPTKQIQCMMKIFIAIDRKGTVKDIRILQGSGQKELDTWMRNAFNYAATSIPPLPDFITEDPYPMTWLIEVNVNTQPRFRSSMH